MKPEIQYFEEDSDDVVFVNIDGEVTEVTADEDYGVDWDPDLQDFVPKKEAGQP